MPAHRCIGCVCKPHQVGDGRARAEPPCLEQRLIHDPGQRRRRAGREDINQCARALLSPDLGDRRHGFELWQRDIGHANRAYESASRLAWVKAYLLSGWATCR